MKGPEKKNKKKRVNSSLRQTFQNEIMSGAAAATKSVNKFSQAEVQTHTHTHTTRHTYTYMYMHYAHTRQGKAAKDVGKWEERSHCCALLNVCSEIHMVHVRI